MEDGTRNTQPNTPLRTNDETLFDTLSTDTLTVIARKLGRSPISQFGDEPMPVEPITCCRIRLLELLFSENSPLSTVAATVITEIEVRWPLTEQYCGYWQGTVHIGPEVFEGEAKEKGLAGMVFAACGPSVRRVRLYGVPRDETREKNFLEQLMLHLSHYCRNVEEIEVWNYQTPLTKWGTASSFFREYAANLRGIDWRGQEDEAGLPDWLRCENLRRLKSRRLNIASLVSLLQASGLTLEELGHEHFVEVVVACTNLEVTLLWGLEVSIEWQHIKDLGPRVVHLNLGANLLHGKEYPAAIDKCSAPQELDLTGCIVGLTQKITVK